MFLLHLKKMIKLVIKKLYWAYTSANYPLLPITKLIREPMRWYYHRYPVLRHDSKPYLKPYVLLHLHQLFVVDHPPDFLIYRNKIKFRSFGSVMSIQGYYVGEIEYHLVQYVVNQICPNFVMVDVGAHHGLYTLAVAHELRGRGLEGKIYSFEPDPKNFSLLEYNVEQNNLSKYVSLRKEAVANVKGKKDLLIFTPDNSGNLLKDASDCLPIKDTGDFFTEEVSVTTLDSLIDSVSRINLIKLDIQGGEPLALSGAKKIIERDKPILVIEAVQEWSTSSQIRDFLSNQNYLIYGLNANSQLCQIDSPNVFVSWDWVALPS